MFMVNPVNRIAKTDHFILADEGEDRAIGRILASLERVDDLVGDDVVLVKNGDLSAVAPVIRLGR